MGEQHPRIGHTVVSSGAGAVRSCAAAPIDGSVHQPPATLAPSLARVGAVQWHPLRVWLSQNPSPKTRMTPAVKTAAMAGAIVVAACALNPSAERHRNEIKEAIAERSPLAGFLGVGALAAFASNYHSVGIASYTSIHNKTLSVGFMGLVFVVDSPRPLTLCSHGGTKKEGSCSRRIPHRTLPDGLF